MLRQVPGLLSCRSSSITASLLPLIWLYEIAAAFRKTGLVEAAYVKPAAEPPINRMQPAAAPAPAAVRSVKRPTS
jgi:hypothetical protein